MTRTEIDSDLIQITVNGEERSVAAGLSVAGLLEELALHPRTVVVELNRTILREAGTLSGTRLEPGDTVELVHFVGGG